MLDFPSDVADGDVDQDDDVLLFPGDAVELDGKVYVVQSRSKKPTGYIVADPDAAGVDHKMASHDIKDWHRRGRLRFMAHNEFGLPIGVRESLRRTMRAFTAIERKEMFRRLRYCEAINDLAAESRRGETGMQPTCDAVAAARQDKGSHDWSTVYRWWKDWTRAGRDIRALCPSLRRRGNRERKIEQFMVDAIEKGVQGWLSRGRPKMSTWYAKTVSECKKHHGGTDAVEAILKDDPAAYLWPSYRTFTAACGQVDRKRRLARRNGPQAARQEMYPVGLGVEIHLPFERVECDFKYLRVFVVDDKTGFPLGTPYLMAAIDCFSGVVAGFDIGFDPPSYVSAARCLKHVIGFKDMTQFPRGEDGQPVIRNSYPVNGVPRLFVLDNDTAFHAASFERSARALGCHIDYLPPGEPWKKGTIERFWGTVQTSFVDMFPGKVLRIGQNAGVDYDPSKDAVITLTQLRLFITKALVDVHHIGIEPDTNRRRIDIWNEAAARNPPRPVRDYESLLELVGAYRLCRAERRGIRLFGLRYNSDTLAIYRDGFPADPMVEIRYDPQDISSVWVIDPKQGKSFEVKCLQQDYAQGLSEHQHRVIQRRAKETAGIGRIHLNQLMLAKAELFELGMSMMRGKRSRRTNARLAHFLGVGRELIDEMSKRHQDEAESGQQIAVEEEEDIDDGSGDGVQVGPEAAAAEPSSSLDEAVPDEAVTAQPEATSVVSIATDDETNEPDESSSASAKLAETPASAPPKPHQANVLKTPIADLAQPATPPAPKSAELPKAPTMKVSYDD